MALSELVRPAEIYSDNRGVVQALNKGEVECIIANHKDADLWIQVWDKVNDHNEQYLRLRVAWFNAHTSTKGQPQRT